MQNGLRRAIAAMPGRTFGSRKAHMARSLGIRTQSIDKWTRVPRKRIVAVEKLSGISRELLAPELYRRGQ